MRRKLNPKDMLPVHHARKFFPALRRNLPSEGKTRLSDADGIMHDAQFHFTAAGPHVEIKGEAMPIIYLHPSGRHVGVRSRKHGSMILSMPD